MANHVQAFQPVGSPDFPVRQAKDWRLESPTVAQTCSLLYRRFLTCHLPLASNVPPITNRRYGRLKICATLSGYLPRGEGRLPAAAQAAAEGNGDACSAKGVGTSPAVRWSPEGPYRFEPSIISWLRICRRLLIGFICLLPTRSSSTHCQVWFPVCRLLRQQ